MSARRLRAEAVELVELLDLVARLCIGSFAAITAELRWHDADGDACVLRVAALRPADRGCRSPTGCRAPRWHQR